MTTEQRKAYIAKQAAQAAGKTHRKLTEEEIATNAAKKGSTTQYFGAADEESF